MEEYKDKELVCRDCNEKFIFTAGEQQFYAEKGFESEPVRCKKCRLAHKRQSFRPVYEVVCSKCGNVARLPFEPYHNQIVFCKECHNKSRKEH